jgi:hypothetical protein
MAEVEAAVAPEGLSDVSASGAAYFLGGLKTVVLLVDVVEFQIRHQLPLAAAHPELVGQRQFVV